MNTNSRFIIFFSKRIRAFILEIWYSFIILFPFIIVPLLIFENIFGSNFLSSLNFGLLINSIINKDFFNGQSVVNRILGYQVVDVKTLKPANSFRCLLRNITAPLWFIEGFFAIFKPERRLGDLIAGTKLINVKPSDPELIIDEIRNIKLDKYAITSLLISLVFTILILII